MNRKVVLVISDTHGGHRLGLLRPNTVVSMEVVRNGQLKIERVELPPNPVQDYLNEVFDWALDETDVFAKGDEIVLVHGGDITHGNRYVSQLITPQIGAQCEIAEKALSDVINRLNIRTVRLVKGTSVHVFDEGGSDSIIATAISYKFPAVDTKSYYHGLMDIDGMTIDTAHHGPPPGSRKWLEGNEMRYYLRSRMMNEIMNQKRPPRAYLRFHYHQYWKESLSIITEQDEYNSTIVLCPSFCMTDDYAIKVVKSPDKFYCGAVLLEIIDGRLTDVVRLVKAMDVRVEDKL